MNVYLPELPLLTESEFTTGTPVPAWDYVWFAGQPLAQIASATGAIHWYFNDHLGTPVLTTDAAGAVDWRLEREPFRDPGSDFALHLKSTLSAVRDLDYAEALSRLSQELFGLDAAQQAFARAQNLSLFKYL